MTSCRSAWPRRTFRSRTTRCSRTGPRASGADPRYPAEHRRRLLYPILGAMSTMPGLSERPAAVDVDIDVETGRITGLF